MFVYLKKNHTHVIFTSMAEKMFMSGK